MMVYPADGLPETDEGILRLQLEIANKKLADARTEREAAERASLRAGLEVLQLRRQVESLKEQLEWWEQEAQAGEA